MVLESESRISQQIIGTNAMPLTVSERVAGDLWTRARIARGLNNAKLANDLSQKAITILRNGKK